MTATNCVQFFFFSGGFRYSPPLRSAGLRVKERKCSFAKNKCVYLGYVVGVAQ